MINATPDYACRRNFMYVLQRYNAYFKIFHRKSGPLINFTLWSLKWTRWYRTKISAVTSCCTSLPTRDAINHTGRNSNQSHLKYRNWTTLLGTLVAVLQNVLDERSFLCEQENYFLKLMVQWWVPVNDDLMERFVLDVILCKHCDRPANSNNGYK